MLVCIKFTAERKKTMIEEVEESIFDNLPENSVIIHQCNALGWIGTGISKEIARRWPECFSTYHNHCLWFKDGHEDEIIGTFARYEVSPTLIICNAITARNIGKARQLTDYDAWEKLCRTVERQTRYVNTHTGKNWTLHIPYKIGCGTSNGLWENMMEIFERYFANSSVKLVIHHYC